MHGEGDDDRKMGMLVLDRAQPHHILDADDAYFELLKMPPDFLSLPFGERPFPQNLDPQGLPVVFGKMLDTMLPGQSVAGIRFTRFGATDPWNQLRVTWSISRRNSPYANVSVVRLRTIPDSQLAGFLRSTARPVLTCPHTGARLRREETACMSQRSLNSSCPAHITDDYCFAGCRRNEDRRWLYSGTRQIHDV